VFRFQDLATHRPDTPKPLVKFHLIYLAQSRKARKGNDLKHKYKADVNGVWERFVTAIKIDRIPQIINIQ
jgi:hypothetical protein